MALDMETKGMIKARVADLLVLGRSDLQVVRNGFEDLKRQYAEDAEAREFILSEELLVYEKLRRLREAIQVADELLRLNPLNADALMKKAKCLGIVGRISESVALFEQLLTFPVDDEKARIIHAHYVKMLMSNRMWVEAMDVLNRALVRFPGDVVFKTKLAMCLKAEGRLKEALSVLNSLPQNDPYVRMEKGHIYLNMLNAPAAKRELKKAKTLFILARQRDARLRNRYERESLIRRFEALQVALKAVEGEVEEAKRWLDENYNKFPAAKLVGVVLDRIAERQQHVGG